MAGTALTTGAATMFIMYAVEGPDGAQFPTATEQ